MIDVKIKIKFTLDSQFTVSADRAVLWVDKPTYLDPRDKKISIPATSIKGVLRAQAESVLRSLGEAVCESPQPHKLCNDCIICKIFGSPKLRSPLVFSDAKIEEGIVDTKVGVGINRRRKTSQENFLYTIETAQAAEFSTTAEGRFADEKDVKDAIAVLLLASSTQFAIGGNKSRGLGWIQLEKLDDFQAFIDGKTIEHSDIQQHLKEMLRQ